MERLEGLMSTSLTEPGIEVSKDLVLTGLVSPHMMAEKVFPDDVFLSLVRDCLELRFIHRI